MNSNELHQLLIDAIQHWEDSRFEEIAKQIFTHQYTQNAAYRTFCENRGLSPENIKESDQIPAVPADAFKLVDLFINAEPTRTFYTSGTTGADRGAHYFLSLDAYRASLHPTFTQFCHPEREPLRMIVLAPDPEQAQESSLCFMLGELVEKWGDAKSAFFVSITEGAWKIETQSIERALQEACDDDAPTMVFGTAFAFAEFFDATDDTFHLPEGSKLMETGGFKGRTKTVSRRDLYAQFTDILGLPREVCFGEYSMTELSSQTYTKPTTGTARFYAPPWLKIQIVDPIRLIPFDSPGRTGLIRFMDLANIDSVMAIQTSDRGVLHGDGGLELLGRAPDAELRGCSLAIEDLTGAPTAY